MIVCYKTEFRQTTKTTPTYYKNIRDNQPLQP